MKKIIIIIALALLSVAIWYAFHKTEYPTTPYTNVIIKNSSHEDSVLVYVTLQAPNSVVGLFGMTADDTVGSCSKGQFYAFKDSSYESDTSATLFGVVISFGGDNWDCQTAIDNGVKTGVNIFECSVNTKFEVFDISCEDGMNSMLKVSVSDTVNWTTGDGSQILVFDSTKNVFPLHNNVNIRGVFPYRCTDCKDLGTAVPKNCFGLRDTCSTYRTCQVARTGFNGGYVLIEYLGGVPEICE